MKIAGWITLLYGVLVLVGGIMGHVKSASTASLVMGSVFGLLLIITSFGMFRDQLFPTYMGLLLTLLLTAFFIYRYLITFTFFPAGFMSVISLGVLIAVVILVRNHLRNQRQK